MSFSSRTTSIVGLVLSAMFITVAFQNCAEGLPDLATQASTTNINPETVAEFPGGTGGPLSLTLPKSDLNFGERQVVQASGGRSPYSYSIAGGPASINSSTGEMLAGSSAGAVTVRVTDNAGTVLDKGMTVGTGYSNSVTPGSISFTSPGTHSFTIPAYVKISVDVRGAGGGGGGSNVDLYGGTAGSAGGGSSALGVSAAGGAGGNGCNYYAGVNYYPEANAAAGGNGGGSAGGAGGLYGLSRGENGGRGGQVSAQFVINQSGAPAVGTVIAVTVGAGGAGGMNGTYFGPTESGAAGSVTISWGR